MHVSFSQMHCGTFQMQHDMCHCDRLQEKAASYENPAVFFLNKILGKFSSHAVVSISLLGKNISQNRCKGRKTYGPKGGQFKGFHLWGPGPISWVCCSSLGWEWWWGICVPCQQDVETGEVEAI